MGAIYEVGALCALEEAIDGLDCSDCAAYVGVSAGAFIAACLANGMSPRQLCAGFIENTALPPDSFDPAELLGPAWDEYRARLKRLPGRVSKALWSTLVKGRSLLSAMESLGGLLPTGLLSSNALGAQLERQFSLPGRSNDFRTLKRRLVLVATDLDSGDAAPFGLPGWDHVPISLAAQASAALPGLFPPVEIDGRHYVDGALKKTLHASVLLDQGLDLLICLNPLVPYRAGVGADAPIHRMADGGLPLVLSQTLRSLIHSRLELGMKRYESSHPDTDIVLFQPDAGDAEIFMANTFSYTQRRHLVEHAYKATRAALRHQAATLGPKLARHGLALRADVLAEPDKRLLAPLGETPLEQSLRSLRSSLSQLEARVSA